MGIFHSYVKLPEGKGLKSQRAGDRQCSVARLFGLPATFRLGSAALLVFLFCSLFGAACLLPVTACTMTEETMPI